MGPAHSAGHGVDRDVVQAQTGEDPLVGVAVQPVGGLQAGVVHVEGVGVLHDELAAADQSGARAGLVAVLGLDLVDHRGQVLVGGVHVFDQEGEHLLVGGRQEVVVAPAVGQGEQGRAVLLPATARLVRVGGQQPGEVHLLAPDAVHLFAHDPLDLAQGAQSQRQPRVDAGGGAPDVAGAHEQPVAGDLGVSRILAQRSDKGGGQRLKHGAILRVRALQARPGLARVGPVRTAPRRQKPPPRSPSEPGPPPTAANWSG